MDLLVLGGTVFLGRALVDAALDRGHNVTLFNRGQHGAELFPDLEKLRGDRDGDLGILEGRTWDAALDTCGYVPRHVRASATLLADAVSLYHFVSTVSVYPDDVPAGVDETTPTQQIVDPTVEKVDGVTYGPLKALCESAAEEAMPGRVLISRPGLIVGPTDPTDRFTYWPLRIQRGGRFVAPVGPEMPVQVIDVRDLAEWTIRMVEAGRTGIFNAVGPHPPIGMGDLVHASVAATGSDAVPVWASEDFLLERNVAPFSELPLWLPRAYWGLSAVDAGRARESGLTFRPLIETVRDTLAWAATRSTEYEMRAGLAPDTEQKLLKALG